MCKQMNISKVTVEQLRNQGLKVYVRHGRYYDVNNHLVGPFTRMQAEQSHMDRTIFPRGGVTDVEIYSPEGELLTAGHAVCSLNDQYSKRLGRQIAMGRALSQLPLHSAEDIMEIVSSNGKLTYEKEQKLLS